MNAHNPLAVNDPWAYWWRLGYTDLIPVVPPNVDLWPCSNIAKRLAAGEDSRGKAPGLRGRDGRWGGFTGWSTWATSEPDLERWRDMGASIGLRGSGKLAAIDADTLDEALAAVIKEIVERYCGKAPIRVGNYPKALYLIRTSAPFPYMMFPFGQKHADGKRDRVEILTTGKQFVVYGQHATTGRDYHWPRPPVAFDALAEISPETLRSTMAEIRAAMPEAGALHEDGAALVEVDQDSLRGDPETVRKAVAAVGNTTAQFPTREAYVQMGYAIKGALGDAEGLPVYLDWCAAWKEGTNDPEIAEADWNRMKPPFRVGAPKLFRMANEATGGAFVAQTNHEEVKTSDESIFPEEKPAEAPSLLGSVYSTPATSIPPRQFLYGHHYLRQYVSATIAPTKVGKTSLSVVEALAMASGKPLLGVKPTGLWRVRLWNGEDPTEELDRRIAAAMQEYGLTMADIGDRLLRDSGRDMPICVATQGKDGAKVWRPVVAALEAAIAAQKIDVLGVDPFVKSHGVSENDNMAVDTVVREWNGVAGRTRTAIDLVHHSRKLNGGEASIDDARGASALVSAARSARVLARMTKTEGLKLGKSKDYRRFFRFADAVSNMAAPAGEDEIWLELKSVDLHNGVFDDSGALLWPSDQVGVVRVSGLKNADVEPSEATDKAERQALDDLASGEWREDVRSRGEWAGVVVARAYGLDLDDLDERERAKAILKSLIKSGKLATEIRKDEKRRPRVFVRTAATPSISDSGDLFG